LQLESEAQQSLGGRG